MIEVTTRKKPKLPRRPRLRDWPLRVWDYHVVVVGELPDWVAEAETQLRRCWNDLAFELKRTLAPLRDANAPDKDKRKAIKPLRDTKHARSFGQVYKGQLPSDCYYAVVDRFLKAMQEAPRVRQQVRQIKGYACFEDGLPRPKYPDAPASLNLPVVYNACAGQETTFADLYDAGGNVSLYRLPEAAPGASHNVEFRIKQPQGSKEKLRAVKLLVDFHRLPPPHAIVKKVALLRQDQQPFPAQWSLQFTLEMPPLDAPRRMTGRVAGYDSGGWRIFPDRIRIGVLADNAGHYYEVSVPRDMANNRARRSKKKFGAACEPITTWDGLIDLRSQIGTAVQECKDALTKIYAREKDQWPPAARQMMGGLVKMRQRGLQALRQALGDRSPAAADVLDSWAAQDATLYYRQRAFEVNAQQSKLDAYRKIAAWLARNFDVIAWEGNLSLKAMAEQPTDKGQLQRAQRQRQIVGQSHLRTFVRQATAKFRCDLRDRETAYSTQTCPECGGHVEQTGKLLLVCENRHQRDQDVAASYYYRNTLQEHASITAPPVEISTDLRRYVRVMAASETAAEVVA